MDKKRTNKQVAVSILDIDITKIAKTIAEINNSGACSVHYDVMDGTFVRNISFGNLLLEQFKKLIKIPIDVHLMVNDPSVQFMYYKDLADTIYFHFEAMYYREIVSTLLDAKTAGINVGIAVKPKTNIEQIYEYIKYCDEILIMTVEPGMGGQEFIDSSWKKIKKLSQYIKNNEYDTIIAVDGGINDITATSCYEAGCVKFISGNFIINNRNKSINEAVLAIKND